MLVDQRIVSKAVIDYLVRQKVPETLASEIVRPSPEAAELLSVSTPLAAAATGVRDFVLSRAPSSPAAIFGGSASTFQCSWSRRAPRSCLAVEPFRAGWAQAVVLPSIYP